MGASPSKMFVRGYPDMREIKSLITMLNRAGWHAAPYMWVDGVAGEDDPWAQKNSFWVSRYGEGDNAYAVISNPTRQKKSGVLRISGAKFGVPGAIYADISGKETVNRFDRNGDTLIDFELPPLGYLVFKQTGKDGSQKVAAKLPLKTPGFTMDPADDSWVEALPLSDDRKGALAAIVGEPDEVAALDYLVTSLSTYSAFHRGRLRVPAPRLWHLIGTFQARFRFPVVTKSNAKTIFALGATARKNFFPGVNARDQIVYRQEKGRHFVGFFPGKMSEAELLKAFLFRLDKAYPFVAGTMSDWPGKIKAGDKAFRKDQPPLADALVHPAYGVRFALKENEIAVARRNGKLFLRTRFSNDFDLVSELIRGSNGQFEFGSSRKIPAGLGVTSDAMLSGSLVYGAIDEGAPVLTTYGNVGANHGALTALTLTVPGHGFTAADIGKSELLAANKRKYYILQIINADTILVMSENIGRNGIGFFDRSSLRANTGFTCNGKSYKVTKLLHTQLLPNARIKKQNFLLDGAPLPEGEFIKRGKKLTCDESYEVVSPVGLLDLVLKNPGKKVDLIDPAIPGALEVNNFYTFTPDGTMYLDQKTRFLEKTAVRQLGLLQTQIIYTPGRNPFREYYVPKTLPFEEAGRKFDFAGGVDSTAKLPRIFFTGSRIADPENLPDRFIQIAGVNNAKKGGKVRETGLVIGYSLTKGATIPAVRKNAAGKQPVWINVTQKSYPYVIYSQGGIIFQPGSVVEASGYRKLFDPARFGKIAPASYTVCENGETLLYLHFSAAGSVDVPEGFSRIVEKSSKVLFSGGKATASAAGEWIVLKK